MDRRRFLAGLLGGVTGAAIRAQFDVERLLWVPGAKTIFLPTDVSAEWVSEKWVIVEAMRRLTNSRIVGGRFYEPEMPRAGRRISVKMPSRYSRIH